MLDVSRDTARRGLSCDGRLGLAERYAELLADRRRGARADRAARGARLWERHLLNCAVVAEGCPRGRRCATSARAPGCPVSCWPGAPGSGITLLEPLLRRTNFLTEVVERAGPGPCEVRARPCRGVALDRDVDVVTARAVAPLDRLPAGAFPCSRPAEMLALKGDTAEAELEAVAARRSGGPQRAVEGWPRVVRPVREIRVGCERSATPRCAHRGPERGPRPAREPAATRKQGRRS